MTLFNCKITIEPKDMPHLNHIFWNAEATFDESILGKQVEPSYRGTKLDMELRLFPDATKDRSHNIGVIGDFNGQPLFKKGQPIKIGDELFTVAEDVYSSLDENSGTFTINRWS